MSLRDLYRSLIEVCDPSRPIEAVAIKALAAAADRVENMPAVASPQSLQPPFQDVLAADDAHPVCMQIAAARLPWAVPQTSGDAKYRADSVKKMIVELIGPGGMVTTDDVRVGLYGILPGAKYGFRTHPAEEVFIMLAGEADWAKADSGFATLRTGARAYHPSMMRHATRTNDYAFMSFYIWSGDISFDRYRYDGRMPS